MQNAIESNCESGKAVHLFSDVDFDVGVLLADQLRIAQLLRFVYCPSQQIEKLAEKYRKRRGPHENRTRKPYASTCNVEIALWPFAACRAGEPRRVPADRVRRRLNRQNLLAIRKRKRDEESE